MFGIKKKIKNMKNVKLKFFISKKTMKWFLIEELE